MRLGPGSAIARAKAASNASAVSQRTAGTPRPLARLTQSMRGSPRSEQAATRPAPARRRRCGPARCRGCGRRCWRTPRRVTSRLSRASVHSPCTVYIAAPSPFSDDHLAARRGHRGADRHRDALADRAAGQPQPVVRPPAAGGVDDRLARGDRVVRDDRAFRQMAGDRRRRPRRASAAPLGAASGSFSGWLGRGLGRAERIGQRVQRRRAVLAARGQRGRLAALGDQHAGLVRIGEEGHRRAWSPTSTIRSTPARSFSAISPKYIIRSGAKRPAPRGWRAMKVSVSTRTPARRKPAGRLQRRLVAGRRAQQDHRLGRRLAAAAATSSTAPPGTDRLARRASLGAVRVGLGDQAQSAGRIRLAEPPGGP